MNNSNQDNSKFEYQMPNKYLGEEFERDMHELHKTLEHQQSKEQQTAIDAANQAIKSVTERPSVFGNTEKQPFANTPDHPELDHPESFVEELDPAEAAKQMVKFAIEIQRARQESNLTQDDFNLAA